MTCHPEGVRMTCRLPVTTALHKAYRLPCFIFQYESGERNRLSRFKPHNLTLPFEIIHHMKDIFFYLPAIG